MPEKWGVVRGCPHLQKYVRIRVRVRVGGPHLQEEGLGLKLKSVHPI